MSSLPSENGVAILRQAAATAHVKAAEEAGLREQIESLAKKLDEVVKAKAAARHQVLEQLKKMDCASNLNNGWEGRIIWMLGELTVQAEDWGRGHP